MAVSHEFQFCNVCRCNHNLGRKHIYSKKHTNILQSTLHAFGKKIDQARSTLIAPSVVDGELEPGAQFWCHFCGIKVKKHVTDGNTSIQYGGVFEHLASDDHIKNTNSWWAENGADKTKKNKFILTQHDLIQFKTIVEEKLNDLEKELENNRDKTVLSIRKREEIQKQIAEQPPAPYIPPPTIYRTVRNHLGILQNPTGCHEGQRVWGGGIVKYRSGSDQWYPWEFDLDDGRKFSGCTTYSTSCTSIESRKTEEAKGTNEEDNIHTGATPPWLVSDDGVAESPMIGPSQTEYQKHVERTKKLGRNPNRVGANFDRKTEVSSEWLPSFGGVWNAGPRWQTRRDLKSKRQEKKR